MFLLSNAILRHKIAEISAIGVKTIVSVHVFETKLPMVFRVKYITKTYRNILISFTEIGSFKTFPFTAIIKKKRALISIETD